MNRADEQLRAAARTAADMFPKGGKLPPLRLAERVGGRRAHASPAGGARMVRRWFAPLTAAAAVIAVVGVLTVPHLIAGNAGHHKPEHQIPAASQHGRRQLDALVAEWVAPATGSQYDRGGRVIWMLKAQELRSFARCMAGKGYHISDSSSPYNLADFTGWVAGFLDGAGSRGASNRTMQSLARHWTSVFVTCATPIVGIWQRILLDAQPGFLHQHAQQIARLDNLASRELVQQHD